MRQTSQKTTANREPANQPDWIAKSPKRIGRKERLERIGAAWTRDDGGICLRLHGTQIVEEDIYLFPNEVTPEQQPG